MYAYRKVIKVISKYDKKYEYYTNKGNKITDNNTIDYIKSLKIPPAYNDVKINLNKNAKLRVTGYDVKGKKQYIYNNKWVENRCKAKVCNMIPFGLALPKIEKDLNKNMEKKVFDKNKLISIIIRIIMECNFRVGNPIGKDVYNSYGATTILKNHVIINGNNMKIDFIGKRGVRNICTVKDKQIKKNLKELYDKTKKNKDSIFSFKNDGYLTNINSSDVNDFIKQYGDFTSKDFRTWYANVYFIDEINSLGSIPDKITHRKKYAREAIQNVANKLHHTVAISKKKYIVLDMINIYIEHPNKYKKLVSQNYKQSGILNPASNSFLNFLKYYCLKK